ncbi:aldehyde dehydrogenase domain-containing protein [Bisporella sp. PMI_857]|nr:aldehyde dehydrogenase domain-containing protein [Bisporella sp. PMI_857]
MATISIKPDLLYPSLFGSQGLIAGTWKSAQTKKTFPVIEPSSGNVLGHCANFSQHDFVEAIDSAHEGYQTFSASTTAKERGAILRRWNDLILQNSNDLAKILSLENGKTFAEAKGEINYSASFVSWFAEEATRSYGDTIPSSAHDTTILTFKEPVGVCGIITPWNFPAAMITRKIAPALAAGCSVVIKPPSETPFSCIALAKLALEAGVPSSCLHVVPTKDRIASLVLATHPKVKKLSFTGSTEVGKMLTELAAATMKRVSMELGGNAPFIVFNDANLDLAVAGAMVAKFRCSGQTCVCANRILVQSSILGEFTEKLVSKVKELKLGPGLVEGTTQGPLVNAAAVEKVSSHVKDAISKGGLAFFFEPTVITNATTDMAVANDETFGPLAAIFSFDTEEEAVDMANCTEYGLAGYFFSKDIGRVLRVAKKLQCGMVGVNTGLISAAESPFGGIKESGLGREGSRYGLAEYQYIKAVTIGNNQD